MIAARVRGEGTSHLARGARAAGAPRPSLLGRLHRCVARHVCFRECVRTSAAECAHPERRQGDATGERGSCTSFKAGLGVSRCASSSCSPEVRFQATIPKHIGSRAPGRRGNRECAARYRQRHTRVWRSQERRRRAPLAVPARAAARAPTSERLARRECRLLQLMTEPDVPGRAGVGDVAVQPFSDPADDRSANSLTYNTSRLAGGATPGYRGSSDVGQDPSRPTLPSPSHSAAGRR